MAQNLHDKNKLELYDLPLLDEICSKGQLFEQRKCHFRYARAGEY